MIPDTDKTSKPDQSQADPIIEDFAELEEIEGATIVQEEIEIEEEAPKENPPTEVKQEQPKQESQVEAPKEPTTDVPKDTPKENPPETKQEEQPRNELGQFITKEEAESTDLETLDNPKGMSLIERLKLVPSSYRDTYPVAEAALAELDKIHDNKKVSQITVVIGDKQLSRGKIQRYLEKEGLIKMIKEGDSNFNEFYVFTDKGKEIYNEIRKPKKNPSKSILDMNKQKVAEKIVSNLNNKLGKKYSQAEFRQGSDLITVKTPDDETHWIYGDFIPVGNDAVYFLKGIGARKRHKLKFMINGQVSEGKQIAFFGEKYKLIFKDMNPDMEPEVKENPQTEEQAKQIKSILRKEKFRVRQFKRGENLLEVMSDGKKTNHGWASLTKERAIALRNLRKQQGYLSRIVKLQGGGYGVYRSLTHSKGHMTRLRIESAEKAGIIAESHASKLRKARHMKGKPKVAAVSSEKVLNIAKTNKLVSAEELKEKLKKPEEKPKEKKVEKVEEDYEATVRETSLSNDKILEISKLLEGSIITYGGKKAIIKEWVSIDKQLLKSTVVYAEPRVVWVGKESERPIRIPTTHWGDIEIVEAKKPKEEKKPSAFDQIKQKMSKKEAPKKEVEAVKKVEKAVEKVIEKPKEIPSPQKFEEPTKAEMKKAVSAFEQIKAKMGVKLSPKEESAFEQIKKKMKK